MARFLPEWVAPDGEITRPTASEINELAPQQQTVTVAGYNEPVPFVYGQQQVGGPIIAGPVSLLSNRSLVYAVALCRSGARRIESVDAVMINGVDQGTMPDINVNPTIVSKSGINFRIYNGTQIREDDTLKAALGAGFEDYFPETAYVVITVPVDQANDFNIASSIIWTIKGRRCLDPRTNTYAWTENPSLHLADFVTCKKYGLDREIIGVEECANWNDSLYNGLPRARTGLVLNEALEEHQVLDLMSTYAECLWSYEGRLIRIIADAPVETPVAVIRKDQIRDGTVTISGANQANFPTALSIIFSDRSRPEEWGSIPAHVQSADHDIYGSVGTQSDLSLLGVYRRTEADRRAWSRFMRLQVPGKISFQMFDDGVSFQTGDVLEVPDYMGLRSVLIRITSQVEAVDLGIYQIHGEIYKDDFYPQGLEGAALPVNGVLFDTLSRALTEYSEINTLAKPLLSAATVGEKAAINPPSGSMTTNMTPGGYHYLPTDVLNPRVGYSKQGANSVRFFKKTGSAGQGEHTHTATLNMGLFNNTDRLDRVTLKAQKLTSPTASGLSTVGLCFLAVEPLSSEGFYNETIYNGYILQIGPTVAKQEALVSSFSIASTYAGPHDHAVSTQPEKWSYPVSTMTTFGEAVYSLDQHSHSVSASAAHSVNAIKMALYRCVKADLPIPKGAIIGFAGSTIPVGWFLCNGSNGTPDLTNRLIQLSSPHEAGQDNGKTDSLVCSLQSGGVTSTQGAHKHKINAYSERWEVNAYGGSHAGTAGAHNHQMSGGGTQTFAFRPASYGLKLIQYKGE